MKNKGFSFRSLFVTRKKRPGPAAWLAVVFGLYCLLFGVVMPHFARPFLEILLSGELGAHCAVGTLRVNPLTWKIVAKNVSVPYPLEIAAAGESRLAPLRGRPAPSLEIAAAGESRLAPLRGRLAPSLEIAAAQSPMPERDFIRLERLEFFIAPSSLAKQTLIVNEVRLVKPRIAITRYMDGSLSPQYLFAGDGPGDGQGDGPGGGTGEREGGGFPFPLVVRNITIRDGSLLFKDEPGDATYDIKNIGATLPFASTLDSDRETPLTPTITALVNGRPLTVTGETRPFAKTRRTVFTLQTRDLSLPDFRGYIAPYTNLVPEKGNLRAALTLRLDLDGDDALRFALAGTVEITDLALAGPEGIVFEAKRAVADMENVLLGPRRVVVNEVSLENPKAVFRRGKDGKVDWPSFFDPPEAVAKMDVRITAGEGTELAGTGPGSGEGGERRTPPPKLPQSLPLRLVVGKVAVTGGTVEWHDVSTKTPVRYLAENIEAVFSDVSFEGAGKADFALAFGKGEQRAALKGRATTAPLRADVSVTLQNIPLSPFVPYIAEGSGITLHSGPLDASGDISFRLSPEKTIIITNATVSVADVRIKDARHPAASLFAAKKIGLAGASLDLAAKTLRINTLSGAEIAVNILRGQNGAFVFPESPAGTPWDIAVSSLHLAKSTLSFVDASLRKTASIPLADVTVTGKDFATAGKKEWSVAIAGKPGTRGELGVTAKGTLRPLDLAFSGTVDKADIRPFSPYLQENSRLSLAEATLGGDFKGTLKQAGKSGRDTAFSIGGNLGLYGVSLVYGEREIAGWGRMRAEDVVFRSRAAGGRSLSAGSVVVNAPRLAVTIDENGVNSITKALQTPPETNLPRGANGSGKGADRTAPFLGAFSIGNAAIRQGDAVYEDARVSPPYVLQVNKVDISLKNLSLDPGKSSPFTASMYINGSPVHAGGTLFSLFDSPSGNGRISIRSLDLARFTRYAEKYLGYPVRKGELTADITASLKGKRLDMQNRLVITDLALGKRTDSPDAADISLPTAVAALRDINGVITLDLPVSGTIGDPQFKVSGIVSRMIGNVVVKTVATPFTLIGSLVTGVADLFTGGSGPREARIVFPPGRASLDEAAKSSLRKVGGSLKKYPSARMTLTGTADMAEKSSLVDSWVENRLRNMKYERLPAAQKGKTSPAAITVGPQYDAKEYSDLLFALYASLPFVQHSENPEITSPHSTGAVLRNIRAHHPITGEDLLILADARAKAVYAALTHGNPDAAGRIRIHASRLADSAKTGDRLESYVHIEAVK